MATMYDSVTGLACPFTAGIVAGYIDGEYGPNDPYGSGWSANAWAHYPGAYHVTITVKGTPGARVADVESGAMTPQGAAHWAKNETKAGRRPTIYASEWDWYNLVDPALAGVGLQRAVEVDGWMAWTGHTAIPVGFVAVQFAQDVPGPNGHNMDLSYTNNIWPQNVTNPPILPTPNPSPTPSPPTQEDEMVSPVFSFKPNQLDIVQISEGTLWHKWNGGGGWNNESIGVAGVTYVGQPQVAVLGDAAWVSAEDSAEKAWVFVQTASQTSWSNAELP